MRARPPALPYRTMLAALDRLTRLAAGHLGGGPGGHMLLALAWALGRSAESRAAPGVAVASWLGIGPVGMLAPCRVVRTADQPDRIGFGYGTLAGHPSAGRESFVVSQAGDGTVWFTVASFSRPAP